MITLISFIRNHCCNSVAYNALKETSFAPAYIALPNYEYPVYEKLMSFLNVPPAAAERAKWLQ